MANNVQNSAFPRILFLKKNMNFGELKKIIYYFARKYFKSPLANKTQNLDENKEKNEIYQVDKELEKYKEEKDKEDVDDENLNEKKTKFSYDENKLWDLFDKEYNEIFNNNQNENNKEELEKFFNDFPYKIIIKRNFEDNEDFVLFDGKNNFNNLKSLQITKDEDCITSLFENKDYCLTLVLNSNSQFSISNINLNSCECYTGENYQQKQKFSYNITLDDLLEYFCS